MIELIKKNLFKSIVLLVVLIFDIFIISISLIDSKKDIIAPGGLNEVKSLIEIDGSEGIDGSFNTIYVYSYDHASVLQKIIASFASYNDIFDSNPQIVLTDKEDELSGEIQKNQSIEASLICAYNYAKELISKKIESIPMMFPLNIEYTSSEYIILKENFEFLKKLNFF